MKKIRINSGLVPQIPRSATFQEAFAAFSNGLTVEGRISLSDSNGSFNIRIHNKNGSYDLEIPSAFWNPNNTWPLFLACTTHINAKAPMEIMSHWELLYIMLKERIDYSIRTDTNEIFPTYIRDDINLVKEYCTYTHSNAYNARLKEANVVVLFAPYRTDMGSSIVFKHEDLPLGANFSNYLVNDKKIIAASSKLFNIYPASESMLSNKSKIVVAMDDNGDEPIACGFGLQKDANGDITDFLTVFPRASALPARLKSHLNGNAFGLTEFDEAMFLQDCIVRNGKLVTKDDTFKNILVVYEKVEPDTCRLVGGEIEVSPDIGNLVCFTSRHIETAFDGLDSVVVEEGKYYESDNGFVLLGTSDGEKIFVENVYGIEVKSIQETGYSDSIRIDYVAYYRSGNARITSHSGLKGVTKVMRDCGTISFTDKEGKEQTLNVQGVAGVNSIKAKENTIRLAQAAFAVKYGYYKPKHESGLLDSLDEEEINRAAASVPRVKYLRKRADGTAEWETKLYGLISISVTEIGSHFATLKSQKMSFNALRYMEQNKEHPLAQHIMSVCMESEDHEVVEDLCKSMYDPNTVFLTDNMDVYTLPQLAKMFDKNDIIRDGNSILPSSSKLLNPEFNKGFYINLGAQRSGKYMRIPSANVLNRFCGRQADGKYVYNGLIIEICKVIDAAINGKDQYWRIIPSVFENNQNRPCAFKNFHASLAAMLYKTEIGGQKLVQSLIVPRLKGVNLKQMHDKYVPEGVIVILDDKIYNSLRSYVYRKEEDFETVLIGEFSPFMSFTFRSPFLWKTQTIISEVWNRERFAAYIRDNHGFKLEDYLDMTGNRFCALVSTEILRCSHSDLDGDLLQITTLEGKDAQDMMRSFKLTDVSQKMHEWDEEYIVSEASGAGKLDWTKPYKITKVPVNMTASGDNSYIDLLCNSASAKSAVGPGTNNAWEAGMLFELYYGMLQENHPDTVVKWAGNNSKLRIQLTKSLLSSIDHISTQANEVFVINAIKHTIGGAMQYQKFMLGTIGKNTKSNDEVVKSIVNELGYSRTEALRIVQLATWATQNGALDNIKAFLRMFNKGERERFDGRVVSFNDEETFKWFELIVKHTFFGSMIKPVFDIYKQSIGLMDVNGAEEAEDVPVSMDI